MEKDWVIIKIDKQRMWVSLSIKEPMGEEHPYFSPEFIMSFLRENGITAGINEEAVRALSDHVGYGQEVIVASGKEAVNGRDGFYKYLVVLEDLKSKPVINQDGSVDYYNSLKLAMVKEGDLIAIYEPPTAGEYGYTVFAEMLPPVKGRTLRPLRGKGFTVSQDGREYRAAFDGRIYKENERIIVEKIYTIKGDLDIEKGNIRFNGDVEVNGDVRSGLEIVADGSIFIHGHVGSCKLTAGGNITIKKGVQGRKKCFITADGQVACSFVERCVINAKGNIYADSILDSEVNSRQQVIVSSRKGLVVGGDVSGTQGVMVKESGNSAGTLTVLRAGILTEAFDRLQEIVNEHSKGDSELELLDKNLKIFDSLDGSKRTKETESMRMKILRAKIIKATEQKKLAEEMAVINDEIDCAKRNATVRVTGIVHPGTQVVIGKNSYCVKEACREVCFRLKKDGIAMLSDSDEKS